MIRTSSGWRGAALAAVFLLAAILGWAVNVRCMAEPKIRIDAAARLNELAAARQPEGENAWPIYQQTIAIRRDGVIGVDGEMVSGRDLRLYLNMLTDLGRLSNDQAELDTYSRMSQELVDILTPILALIDRASECSGFFLQLEGSSVADANNRSFGARNSMHILATLNANVIRVSAHHGDWDDALKRFRTGYTLSRHMSMTPLMLYFLSAATFRNQIHLELQRLLMELDVSADVCEKFLDVVIAQRQFDTADLDFLIGALRIEAEDHRQRHFSDNGRGGGVPIPWTVLPEHYWDSTNVPSIRARLLAIAPSSLMVPSRRETARIDEQILKLIEQYLTGTIDDIDARRRIGQLDRPFHRWQVVPRFEPLYIAARFRALATTEAVTEVMLRLTLHKARTGAWPATLEEAMTREKTLDPNTGDPFGYVLAPEDDEHGRPFLLLAPESSPGRGRRAGEWIMNAPRPDR